MLDRQRIELVCDACGRRKYTEMHAKLAEAVQSRNPLDKISQILCSKCSAERAASDSWSIYIGPESE